MTNKRRKPQNLAQALGEGDQLVACGTFAANRMSMTDAMMASAPWRGKNSGWSPDSTWLASSGQLVPGLPWESVSVTTR